MTRSLSRLLAGAVALALVASSAAAQDEASRASPEARLDAEPRAESTPSVTAATSASQLATPTSEPIAVLLLPSGEVEPSVADALTELLIAAVAERGGATIVGKEEFQAQLGQGDASTAECLESTTCLGRVGVALGVREVIAGTIGRHGTTWSFALNRIDVRTGLTEGRVFREVEGDLGAVVHSLPQSVDDLYVTIIAPGRLVVRASVEGAEITLDGVMIGSIALGEPVRRDLLAPGQHDVVVRAHGHASYHRTIDIESGTTFALEAELIVLPHQGFEVPVVTWVVGGVAFAALAAGIGFGVSSSARVPDAASMRAVQAFYGARANEAIAADVCFGLALAATVGAVIPLILAATTQPTDPEVSLSIAPHAGGVMVSMGGRFL